MKQLNRKLTLFSIFFTFFIDNLSWAIVFPIFAPYFLDVDNRLFSPEISEATRTTILGFFLMAFSFGQFLGAPLIGEYADRDGRKKALALSVLFTLVGLGLSAWSMQTHNLPLLFFARLITGLFASNMSICLTCVTDLSQDEKEKTKYFGYLSVFAGLSFVLGAFVGGKLSDRELYPLFSSNLPLWLAAGLTFINLLFILFGFRETASIDKSVKFDFFESFRNIASALKTQKIKRIYALYFLFLFAWTLLFQFIPVLVVARYAFSNSDIGDLALYMGICWAVGSGYLNKWLVRKFHFMRVLEGCLLGFTLFCTLIVFVMNMNATLVILGICILLGGLAWPLCTSLVSNSAPREIQGKVLGMSQSVQSLAMALAPVMGGVAFQISPNLPFLLGGVAGLIAGFIYLRLKIR
jgi:DHA1 family tetracycline resistance protein-like MFS transporter